MRKRDRAYSEKRDEICRKALALIGKHGYDNTPISRIAKELSLTKAGIYHYFSSKEEFHFEIHKYYLRNNLIPTVEAAEKVSDPEKRIIVFMEGYCRNLIDDFAARELFNGVRRLTPEHQKEITKIWRRAYDLVRDAVTEMEEMGRGKRMNRGFAAFAAIGMCSWISYWYDNSRNVSREELGKTFVEIFFHGFINRAPEQEKG